MMVRRSGMFTVLLSKTTESGHALLPPHLLALLRDINARLAAPGAHTAHSRAAQSAAAQAARSNIQSCAVPSTRPYAMVSAQQSS